MKLSVESLPVAIIMLSIVGRCCAVSAPDDERRLQLAADHASIQAYPQAVVCVKDKESEMLFYVESNGRRLVAFEKDGTVAWSVDVLTEAQIKPARGAPVIRDMKLIDGELAVTCGRSNYAKVELKTGKTKNLGND